MKFGQNHHKIQLASNQRHIQTSKLFQFANHIAVINDLKCSNEFLLRIESSFIWKDLKAVRNARPSFHTSFGLYGGLVASGFTIFMGGREPWTLSHGIQDHARLKPISECKPIEYPKPDNKITFDLLSSVALTGTNHEGNLNVIYLNSNLITIFL